MERKLSPATETQLAQKEIERIDREQAEYDRKHSEPMPPAPTAKPVKLSAVQDKALETYWRTFLKGEEIHTNTISVRDASRDAIVKAGLLQRYLRNNERAGWPKIKFMQFTPAGIAYCEARFGRDMLAKEQAAEQKRKTAEEAKQKALREKFGIPDEWNCKIIENQNLRNLAVVYDFVFIGCRIYPQWDFHGYECKYLMSVLGSTYQSLADALAFATDLAHAIVLLEQLQKDSAS